MSGPMYHQENIILVYSDDSLTISTENGSNV